MIGKRRQPTGGVHPSVAAPQPIFPFRGTEEQQAEFLAAFRTLWRIDPGVDLTINHKWARWYIPMRINERRIYWARGKDAFPWGVITPRMNGWNPLLTHPTELHTWLSIPDAELGAVQRANIGPIRPVRILVKIVVLAVFLLLAMWLVSYPSPTTSALGTTIVALASAKVALGMFGQRLQRNSSFAAYLDRQTSETSASAVPRLGPRIEIYGERDVARWRRRDRSRTDR